MSRKLSKVSIASVIPSRQGTKLLASENKLALVLKISELSNNGERMVRTLLDIMENGDDNDHRIKATKLLLEHFAGTPVQTAVVADATPARAELPPLSNEQLEAIAAGETDAEITENPPET